MTATKTVSVERRELAVPGTEYSVPTIVIKGMDGPRFSFTGGIHADEYVGEQALVELAAELAELPAESFHGTVVLVPVSNVVSFNRRGTSMIAVDGLEDEVNLNRVFPGNPEGNLAERLAYAIFTGAVEGSDFHADLHGGDYYEDLAPYLYYMSDHDCAERSRDLGACCNVPVVIACREKTAGTSYAAFSAAGIPTILLERGDMGAWSREEVDQMKEDVRNMLRYAGILEGKARDLRAGQSELYPLVDLYAPCAGFWYPTKRPMDIITKGELLGQIRNVYGEVLHEEYAPGDGVVMFQTGSLNVVKGGPTICYALY